MFDRSDEYGIVSFGCHFFELTSLLVNLKRPTHGTPELNP